MQTKLPETDERFRLLIENVKDYGIFILDPDGHIASWNLGAQRITGYAPDEIIGRHFSQLYTPDDVAKKKPDHDLQNAEARDNVRVRGWRLRKNGARFWATVSVAAIRSLDKTVESFGYVIRETLPVSDDKPLGVKKQFRLLSRVMQSLVGSMKGPSTPSQNVQDRERIRQMEKDKTAAEKANEAKDEFLALLSHELRTPLTPALAAASYLADHAKKLPPDLQEELATIRRNVQLEARLIDDLLDLTRIVRGKIELHFEVVDAHRVLRETLEVVGDDIIEKELDVGISLSAAQYRIWADPVRIRQVFWNLIRNAVKFTPSRGQIVISSSNDEQGRFRLEVSDTGIGIEPEYQSEIFNAFEQGSREITREFGGLGLGLTISKKLLDLQGGTIALESAGANRGASFKVTLNALHQDEQTNETPSTASFATPKSLRLLLVEDHADTRRTLCRLLSRCGHKVTSTDHVESALKLLDSKRFDAVVSDIGLPDRSGYELMALAKERHQLKGIALSGFGMEEDVRRSLAAGFEHHLTKPVDFRNLRAVLDELVV